MLLLGDGVISFNLAANSAGKLVATSCAGDVTDPADSDGDTTFKCTAKVKVFISNATTH